MEINEIQYITDANGKQSGVVVPIETWNEMLEELGAQKRKKLQEDLRAAFDELKAAQRGETKLLTEEEFWKCL